MSVKTFQSLAGSQGLNKLAVDTTYFEDRGNGAGPDVNISAIDATGGLTTILSLTGKFHIHAFFVTAILANNLDHWKLTIDGVVVNEEDGMSSNSTSIGMFGVQDGDVGDQGIICHESFLLQIQTTSDNSISFWYRVQPIL